MFKVVKNRKRTGYVVMSIANRSDRSTETVFLQTKATHFETLMTNVDEVNSDKTKVLDEFFVRSVLLDCFMVELVNNRCKFTCKHLTKTIQLHKCMQTNNWSLFLCQSVILCCSALKLN